MISFRRVSKTFGIKTLFHELSFSIESGEMVAVTGPSGAGKTTLLHMLLGAIAPDTGRIEIDGFSPSHLSAHDRQFLRRSMGTIFQDFKLLPQKTVFENVAFAMEVCDASDFDIEHRVGEMLAMVGLSRRENAFPHELSGGEQQRVALARALTHSPNLLLADEPTGNLDPDNAREVAELLKKLNREKGLTILVATHDRDLVDALSPRILFLQKGILLRDERDASFREVWEKNIDKRALRK